VEPYSGVFEPRSPQRHLADHEAAPKLDPARTGASHGTPNEQSVQALAEVTSNDVISVPVVSPIE